MRASKVWSQRRNAPDGPEMPQFCTFSTSLGSCSSRRFLSLKWALKWLFRERDVFGFAQMVFSIPGYVGFAAQFFQFWIDVKRIGWYPSGETLQIAQKRPNTGLLVPQWIGYSLGRFASPYGALKCVFARRTVETTKQEEYFLLFQKLF